MKHVAWTKLVRWIPILKNWYKSRLTAQLKARWQVEADIQAAWDSIHAEQDAREAELNAEYEKTEAEYQLTLQREYAEQDAREAELNAEYEKAEAEYQLTLQREWDREQKLYTQLDDDDTYWQEKQDWEDEISEMRHRDFMERSSQWGEAITLNYHHPLFGYIGLTMLEGEWLLSFDDICEQNMLPKEAIDELERKFNKVRRSLYQ